jgi:YidC/Oxa1 family membrane protein insertase
LTELWNQLVVQNLEALLTGLYSFLPNWGLAIIVFTVAIKLLTFPLTYQQIRSSKSMRDVQPLLEEAKKRYGKDREKMSQETMRIYKENGVNPAMGCLPMLIQMPIWFGLYGALLNLAKTAGFINEGFLWLPSLAHPDPYYILVGLTIVTQFVVQKMMTMPSTDPQQQTMNKVMLFMPLTFGFVAASVPSGLALYWVTTNIFTFFQQLLTTGWGELLPKKNVPASPVRVKSPNHEGSAAEVAAASSETKAVKSARQKKQAGAKPPREEKRANGKR